MYGACVVFYEQVPDIPALKDMQRSLNVEKDVRPHPLIRDHTHHMHVMNSFIIMVFVIADHAVHEQVYLSVISLAVFSRLPGFPLLPLSPINITKQPSPS